MSFGRRRLAKFLGAVRLVQLRALGRDLLARPVAQRAEQAGGVQACRKQQTAQQKGNQSRACRKQHRRRHQSLQINHNWPPWIENRCNTRTHGLSRPPPHARTARARDSAARQRTAGWGERRRALRTSDGVGSLERRHLRLAAALLLEEIPQLFRRTLRPWVLLAQSARPGL